MLAGNDIIYFANDRATTLPEPAKLQQCGRSGAARSNSDDRQSSQEGLWPSDWS